jgi:hypothetical protein
MAVYDAAAAAECSSQKVNPKRMNRPRGYRELLAQAVASGLLSECPDVINRVSAGPAAPKYVQVEEIWGDEGR